jgi:hypothetical protein
VLPGSKSIDKICNVTRILETKLHVKIPTATTVRKMSSTAVARKCSERLVARQLNHDPKTSSNYYQLISASNCTTGHRQATYNLNPTMLTPDVDLDKDTPAPPAHTHPKTLSKPFISLF